MAYTFHRDYDIEVIFILYGVGANGKTVFTSLLTQLHGKNNVSNVPLPTILKNKFALSDLENKDLNIDNELPGNDNRGRSTKTTYRRFQAASPNRKKEPEGI